jgi:twitching motility protein PilI
MANKQALRDLQTRLAERMQQVRTEQPGMSWLAVDCAGQGLLLALRQAGEISGVGALVPVPHTRPWLAGVVNLRGGVCTVVDLARFLGLRAPGAQAPKESARLVAFNAALGLNGALLVDRLEGLRHAADLKAEAETADNEIRPAFALARWRDAAGKLWQELDLAELAKLPQFLAVT